MTLDELGIKHGTDKSSAGHDYLSRYEPFLKYLATEDIIELGVGNGASLMVWSDYFPNAHVTGVDNNPESIKPLEGMDDRITPIIGDATDPKLWESFGQFDLIVDDASHYSGHIISTFQLAWPKLKPGGIYIAEDLHCAYQLHPFNDGIGQTSIGFFKTLIDRMNDNGSGMTGARKGGEFYDWIHFSKSFVIIKKLP